MNMNDLARMVTLREGKKVSQSIAQVKETLRITFDILTNEVNYLDLMKMLSRYEKKDTWKGVRGYFTE